MPVHWQAVAVVRHSMKELFNIEQRKPIWIALSEFYLDTELDDSGLRHIAFTIVDSPYTLDEVKSINRYEVFPILQPNLLSSVGVWAGFDEEWLIESILLRLNSKTILNDAGLEISYQAFKWMGKDYWKRLERIYNDINTSPGSYIVTCRAAFVSRVFPFQFEKSQHPIYKKLQQIAFKYKDANRLQEFYQNLQEGHYYINIWTAYFLLELFNLDKTDKLIGLSDNESIFDFCYRLIENTFQSFKDKNQVKNCSYWLEEKRRKTSAL